METTEALSGTRDRLIGLFWQLNEIQTQMAARPLLPVERRELGGHLISNGPGLVMQVVLGLSGRPECFPDFPGLGPQLEAQQKVAHGWRLLRDGLRIMAQLAADAHLKAQSEAIQKAMLVVRTVKDGPAPPGTIAGERNMQLVPAYLVVHAYYQQMQKKKKARREQAATPAADKPATPAQQRARKAVRDQRREQWRDQFRAALASGSLDEPEPAPAPVVYRAAIRRPDFSDLTPEEIVAGLSADGREAVRRMLR